LKRAQGKERGRKRRQGLRRKRKVLWQEIRVGGASGRNARKTWGLTEPIKRAGKKMVRKRKKVQFFVRRDGGRE